MLHWHNMLFVVIWCVLSLTKIPQSNQRNMKQKLKLKWSRKKWGQAFLDLKSRTQLIPWWPSPHLTINTGNSEWLALVKTQPCRKNPQLLLWGALRHLYAKRDAGWGYLNIRPQHVYCWCLNTSGSSIYYSFTILQCQQQVDRMIRLSMEWGGRNLRVFLLWKEVVASWGSLYSPK